MPNHPRLSSVYRLAGVGLIALSMAATGACSPMVTVDATIPVDDTFKRVPATGDLARRLQAMADYSTARGGRALMVLQGDVVVFEEGQNGHRLDQAHHLFSGTKSFTCALYEVSRQQGHLEATTPLRDLVEGPDARVTVDHALHLTTGVREDLRMGRDPLYRQSRHDDIYAETLELDYVHPPGEVFQYGPAPFNLMGAAVTATQGDPVTVLRDHVFKPIGLQTAHGLRDSSGNPTLSLGAWTTVNEWAKYGVLVRDNGVFLGQKILEPGLHDCFQGSTANPAYGRTFWLNRALPDTREGLTVGHSFRRQGPVISPDAPDDLVMAAGHNNQRLYILPSADLVIVRLGDADRRFSDAELLAPLFAP